MRQPAWMLSAVFHTLTVSTEGTESRAKPPMQWLTCTRVGPHPKVGRGANTHKAGHCTE